MRTTSRPLAALAVLLTTALAGIPALSSPADARGDRDRDSVSRAAERYGLSETELKAMLEADPTLRVGGPGLYYIDPAPKILRPAPVPQQAFPLEDTFELHSKPGSTRTIYLDFNGEEVSGTWWNDEGLPDATHPAWTLDGNPGTFNDEERTTIQDIFQRVAEDFAPFDVDVTTEEPSAEALDRTNAADVVYGTRALISPSTLASSVLCGGGCGGIAFIDVFDQWDDFDDPGDPDDPYSHDRFQPAWVFPQALGPDNAKYIADATTHEVGHNLSLMHDGTFTEGYYSGHSGLWGPIMGAPYDVPVTQWGLNDYPGGRLGGPGGDPDGFQANVDDIVTISESGAPIRSDEAGGTVATAAATIPGTGYISSRTDVDVYNLGTCSGTVTVAANNAAVSPNLDIKVELLSAGGTQLAVHDPPAVGQSYDVAGGLDATVTATGAPSATYYARIDGIGAGNATTSYTDYGSVGAYTLEVAGCGSSPEAKPGKPIIGPAKPGRKGGPKTATVSWLPPTGVTNPPIDGFEFIAYKQNRQGRYVRVFAMEFDEVFPNVKYTTPQRGLYKFAVRAHNGLGYGPLSAKSNAVRPR